MGCNDRMVTTMGRKWEGEREGRGRMILNPMFRGSL